MRAGLAAAVLLLAVGCGGSDPASSPDLATGKDLAVFSVCGHPGDTGNSLGVGKYCTKLTDCTSNTKATLCSVLGSDNAFFCTMTCTGGDLGTSECGENAACQCGSGSAQSGCGCYPNACTH